MIESFEKQMIYYKNRIIITCFFILISFYLGSFYQNLLSLILILTIGIIHGANDIMLIQKKTKNYNVNFFFKSILIYVLVVLIGVFLFFYFPSIGLIFFILFSGYHWGEQHWEDKLRIKDIPQSLKYFFYTSYGILVLSILLLIKFDDTKLVINSITNYQISELELKITLTVSLFIFILFNYYNTIRVNIIIETIVLIIFYVLFNYSTLMFGFGVYFVFWHSFPSMKDQIKFLYGSYDNKTLLKYIKSSFIYWAFSILSLFVIYFYFEIPEKYFFPLFFSFLAAITFPHTLVIGNLKRLL